MIINFSSALFYKNLPLLQQVALLLGVLWLVAACAKETPPDVEYDFLLDVNIETGKDVTIIYSDSALVRVKIAGPTMLSYVNTREPQQEFPDGVKVDFYDADGKVTSVLTGKYGIRYETKGVVVVRDSVVWQSVNNEKLETEELIWDDRRERVYNHKFVVVTRPDEIITGHGFEATQDFKYSKVNAVEGRVKIDQPEEDEEE